MAASAEKPKLALDAADASVEERRRFSQLTAERKARREELEDRLTDELTTPREARFVQDMVSAFQEAVCITNGLGFANGSPLSEQPQPKAQVILGFVSAINAYKAGAGEDAPSGDTEEIEDLKAQHFLERERDGGPPNDGGA